MPRVTVAWSPAPREVLEWVLQLPDGSTAQDALLASGWREAWPGAEIADAELGIWGRRCPRDQVLHEGDRLEVYRPLKVDPKVARRERFRKQGSRAAGLFAQRRRGAKPGY